MNSWLVTHGGAGEEGVAYISGQVLPAGDSSPFREGGQGPTMKVVGGPWSERGSTSKCWAGLLVCQNTVTGFLFPAASRFVFPFCPLLLGCVGGRGEGQLLW